MSRKKILILGPLSSQHIQMWYRHFDTTKYDVSVMTIHPGGEKMDEHINVIDVSFFKSRIDFMILAIVFFFYALFTRPALINFHFLSSYGLLALLTTNKNKILSTWGTDVNAVNKNRSGMKRWLIKKALKRYTWINTPAQHMKRKLIDLGVKPSRIEVYQYGIEISDTAPKKNHSPRNTKPMKIVSNRNWGAIYNIDKVIQGFTLWQEKNSSVTAELLLYGSGDEASRIKIDQLIDNSSAKESIRVCGYTPKQKMLEQMADADLFISIPDTDGTPLSLLEAINVGLLPVVSNIDANREWLTHEQAVFVEQLTAEHVSNALQTALVRSEDDSYLQNLTAARKTVVENANYHTNTQRFYDKITELVATNTPER